MNPHLVDASLHRILKKTFQEPVQACSHQVRNEVDAKFNFTESQVSLWLAKGGYRKGMRQPPQSHYAF